jgi:hypothetical protein
VIDISHGMNRQTGKALNGVTHLRQSIQDIVTTPIGSRVMRRTYGSHFFDLVDQPGNPAGRLRMIAAAADAVARWEPRVRIDRVLVTVDFQGRAGIRVQGRQLADNELVDLFVDMAQAA